MTGLYVSFLKGQGHQGIYPLVKGTLWANCQFYWSISRAPRHEDNRRCRMQHMSSMQHCPEDICNNVRRTVLHMQSCPPGRCCIMQLCPPGHICICSCVRPVQNSPCSKLNAIGRRNTLAIFFYKLSACHEWHGKCSAVGYSQQS